MLKLLTITALSSSLLFSVSTSDKVEDFLEEQFSGNKGLSSINVEVVDVVKLDNLKDWNAYIISVQADMKQQNKSRKIKQRMIWFSNGNAITRELTDLASGESYVDLVKPDFKPSMYKKENLIYGNANAKHRVAIFSDPLCPFCRSFVPAAIEKMKNRPDTFAVYYYHFPLERIHPAAVTLVQAAAAAELKGVKDVVLKLYKVEVKPREKDPKKILAAFNKSMKTNIKLSDLSKKEVLKHLNSDMDVAENLMVAGTPTLYFDDKVDRTKRKHEKVK
ncbi:MAG: thioredoxin domain-containing protein [Campylobacterota bacterium]|nr:thioredoxin domain-containing protein [Campylobacterota bacterium]